MSTSPSCVRDFLSYLPLGALLGLVVPDRAAAGDRPTLDIASGSLRAARLPAGDRRAGRNTEAIGRVLYTQLRRSISRPLA